MASRATLESYFYYLRPAQRFPHQLTPCCPPFGYLFIHFTNPIITPSRTAELLISHYQTLSHSPERGDLFLPPDAGAQVSCPVSWALATLGCLLRFFPFVHLFQLFFTSELALAASGVRFLFLLKAGTPVPLHMVLFCTLERCDQIFALGPGPARASSCTLRYFPTLTRLFPPHVLLNTPAAQARQTLLKDRAEMASSSGPSSFAATGSLVRF